MKSLANTEKHQNMVRKLAKDPLIILPTIGAIKVNLLHMIVGITDEKFEYNIAVSNTDKVNQLEELGDMLFYTEGLIIGFEHEVAEYRLTPLSKDETFQLLARTVKRHVFYEQDLNVKDLINVYKNLKSWISYDASQIALTITDVQNHNMAKLAKRYPNFDYSDARAKERMDKEAGDDA